MSATGARHLDVTVPAGCDAELHAPAGTIEAVAAGEHERTWPTPGT